MKFLFALATLALCAVINANPYGYARPAGHAVRLGYVPEDSYGHGSGRQPLIAYNSHASAAAAAAASSAGLRPGNYKQKAVIGYELDRDYHGASAEHHGASYEHHGASAEHHGYGHHY